MEIESAIPLGACAASVIVPAYKVTPYIAETLESIFAQTYRDFEVIVVNDACPDSQGLEMALEPYRGRIRYLRHARNAGPSATRNTGIRASRGRLIAFLDGDDLYEPDYLEVQTGILQNNPGADVVYGSALLFGDDPCVGMPVSAFRPSRGPVTVSSLLRDQVTVLIQSLVRREILFRVGLFDEQLRKCEDFDLWLRIVKAGGTIIYHSRPIAKYRVRTDSASADTVDMCRHRIGVADKMEREMDLTDDERVSLREGRARWISESNLAQAKLLMASGQFREAAVYLEKANEQMRRPKLALAGAAMRWAPGLVGLAMRYGSRDRHSS